MKLYLGLIKNKGTGRIINHRALLKILLNSFLRVVGIQINSILDIHNEKILGYDLRLLKPQLNLLNNLKNSWIYKPDFEIGIIKEHRFI